MKLFLFGGAELQLGHGPIHKDLIKQTIVDLHPSQILHVPFARLHPTEEAFREGWFKELMADTGIEILDARLDEDVLKAKSPLVFINGGHGRADLIAGIYGNNKVLDLILDATYLVGESSGSMVTGEYFRVGNVRGEIVKGLGILKDAIIEPHYSERGHQQLLVDEMQQTRAKIGIGIDCVTGIVIDTGTFPLEWEKIGTGTVDVNETE